jgi:predicted  nucleic acid-binding Zn-ribbon protein
MPQGNSGPPRRCTFQPRSRGAIFLLGSAKPRAKAALLHMNADLTRLIRLQQLESAAEEARRKIADHPGRIQALDARLQAARDAVAGIKARLAAASEKRRAEEKEVAGVQTRLAKYKEQLLELKTNREYTAMLHEIETAQNDIRTREDRILEIMLESDELTAAVKKNEAELKAAEKEVAAERTVLDTEIAGLQAEIDRTSSEREKLVAAIDRHVLNIFETTAKGRKGVAVAEARDGLCTICHVRLRPQVFNEVRKNESIIQCDSCRRILYFAGSSEASAPVSQA